MALGDTIARSFPAEAWLNPARLISDVFYSLYFYESLAPFLAKLVACLGYALVLLVIAIFCSRGSVMSICNTTMRIARRHPFYLVIYVLMLSLLGLILSSSTAMDSPQTSYSSYSTRLVLVDRDDSELSRALHDHLDETCRLIDVADDEDAFATKNAGCVIIIPPNWGASVIQAVRAGEEIPALSCALGYSPQAGALVAQDCARWTSLTASALVLEPSTSITDAVIRTTHAMSTQADLQVIATSSAARATGQFQSYL